MQIELFFGRAVSRLLAICCWCALASGATAAAPRPNILWLSSEDHGPHMGCYGDSFATTPNVDALAAKGMLYTRCWSNAPVCAPARTTLISGMYPPSTGAEHMRSMVPFAAGKQMFPQLLRGAGYYCTNNAKEDYNLTQPGQVWDVSSKRAHWSHRAAGQPFFAVFNSEKSHESRLRVRPHEQVHEPAKVRVPAYHPDTPEVRQDWAQYYDVVSAADADAGARLKELADAGLAEDTIVFYFADHGSGMPRNKRWPLDSGLHVPLVVYIPDKFKELRPPEYTAGGKSDRLVSFVDFAPTVLSLAGIKTPEWMQGHAFLGSYAEKPQPYVYGFRGRMDERPDMVRSVTDGRFVYVRNYLPHKIYGQHLAYMFETPTTRVWHKLHSEGRLTLEQDAFWKIKPAEELYDLSSDRDEVRNLAQLPEYRETLAKLRSAQQALALRIRDVGFLSEHEMHQRSKGTTPYDLGHDASRYPLEQIMAAAELAAGRDADATPELVKLLGNSESAVRYWGALGLLIREQAAVTAGHDALVAALGDGSPDVRIVAAEALARYGSASDRPKSLEVLEQLADWSQQHVLVAVAALNAIDSIGTPAQETKARLRARAKRGESPHQRYGEYVPRLLKEIE